MKLFEILTGVPEETIAPEEISKETKRYADRICKMLFGVTGGPVVDKKRSLEPIYYGLSHQPSKLFVKGQKLKLTFDNSTDSGEFEVNSLAPLNIPRDSLAEKDIKALYRKHGIRSKKKVNYIHSDAAKGFVIREIHFGKELNAETIEMFKDVMSILQQASKDEAK